MVKFSYTTKLELLNRMETQLAAACETLNDLIILEDRAPGGDSQAEFNNVFATVNDLRGQVHDMLSAVQPLAEAEARFRR